MALRLRAYGAADEDACIALWLRAWTKTFADIDFAQRLSWWRARWRDDLVPHAQVVVAEQDGVIIGFVTVNPSDGYLDQIAVDPAAWGAGIAAKLLAEAKRIAPSRLSLLVNTDNARAIRFYRKHGFVRVGEDVNPISGRPVDRMEWTP